MSDVNVRIVAADGTTEVFDFNDRDGGFAVELIQGPDFEMVKVREVADDVDGDYTVSQRDAAGDITVVVRVEGSTWGQTTTRWEAARTAYRSESRYYLEIEIEGVTTRYRTEQPESVQPGPANLVLRRQTYAIRWHVQPNPTVTVA